MKKSRRTRRVSSLIKERLSYIISKEISGPGIGLLTITGVDISLDLKVARIYYTIFGGYKKKEEQIFFFESKVKFMRKRLGEGLKLKYTPFLELHYDETPEKAVRIEKILKKIKNEK